MKHDQPLPADANPRPISEAAVRSFLVTRFGADIQDVSRLGQGEWSTAYAFRHSGAEQVVRFGAHKDDFDKDRLAAGYSSTDLPIPVVVEVGDAFGGYYAVSERVLGGYLDDLDGSQMRALLPSLFATLDAARGADLSGTTGYGAWGADRTAPYLSWRAALLDVGNDDPRARTHGWRARLAGSPVGSGPFDETLEHLRSLVEACPEIRHLIHSDLLNCNVLVHEGRVSAVIDWGCSMYGDFLYDLVWFAYWASWYPAWDGIDFIGEAMKYYAATGLEVPHFAERIRCYRVHIGLSGLAYRAFKGDWEEVEIGGKRTLAIAKHHS